MHSRINLDENLWMFTNSSIKIKVCSHIYSLHLHQIKARGNDDSSILSCASNLDKIKGMTHTFLTCGFWSFVKRLFASMCIHSRQSRPTLVNGHLMGVIANRAKYQESFIRIFYSEGEIDNDRVHPTNRWCCRIRNVTRCARQRQPKQDRAKPTARSGASLRTGRRNSNALQNLVLCGLYFAASR